MRLSTNSTSSTKPLYATLRWTLHNPRIRSDSKLPIFETARGFELLINTPETIWGIELVFHTSTKAPFPCPAQSHNYANVEGRWAAKIFLLLFLATR